MEFFFWQNRNSMHQSAFLTSLVKTGIGSVTLIVTEGLSGFRKEMGWSEPVLEGVKILNLQQDKLDWKCLLGKKNNPECIHIFSGISAFPSVQLAFVYARKMKCRIGIFSEPLDFRGFKGILRKSRGHYHKQLYSSDIEFILATGELGVKQFQSWGYVKDKIFEWAYTVEKSNIELSRSRVNEADKTFKIMFAGSLILRKGYDILIQSLKNVDADFKADFYCLKDDQILLGKNIESESGLESKLSLLPFLPNDDLRLKMNEYDLFILPSRHDGWGAVICESIMEGTPVLVSKFCGSSCLIKKESMGKVLQSLDQDYLAVQLSLFLEKGKVSFRQRVENRTWANETISGFAMAKYFKNIVAYLNETEERPCAPWR